VSRLSAVVPKRLLADRRPPAEVMPEGDVRVEALGRAVVAYDRREDYVREISSLWTRAQELFLTIGRYLILAKQRLPHGEFTAMIERELPFGPTTAFQIRAATEAVTSGRLPATDLPPNYSTIYLLSTLPDPALEQAREAGLLRPDLKRSEVVAFKRRILTLDERPDPDEVRRRRIAALRRQRAEIDEEIAKLEAEEPAGV
jgi:hypothetical protein